VPFFDWVIAHVKSDRPRLQHKLSVLWRYAFPTGPHLGYWGHMRDANKAQLEFTLIAFLTIPPMIYSLWRGAMALIGAD
jgi:hypothetical protein